MMNKFHPSVGAHVINGFFILVALVLLFLNKSRYLIAFVLLWAIAIGIHGLSHLGLEVVYGLEPFHRQGQCPFHRQGQCPYLTQQSYSGRPA